MKAKKKATSNFYTCGDDTILRFEQRKRSVTQKGQTIGLLSKIMY